MVTLVQCVQAPPTRVVAKLEGFAQRVQFSTAAIQHVRRYRQASPWAKEAGGQLFGTISVEQISVHSATGPYLGDERSRYRYRSNPAAAQRAIDEQATLGSLYLGEWHTHAEDLPGASALDDEAMRLLLSKSRLNSNALLMLIVGRKLSADSLGLWSVSPYRVDKWVLEDSVCV